MMAQGGEVEDENIYDFSIRVYKDNLDILNDNPDYEEFRGTKEEVLKKVNDSLEKDEILYAYVGIEDIVTDWYHESGDLDRMRMELNRYGEHEYANGGTIKGRNTSTGETFGVVIGSQKKSNEYIDNGTEVNVRKTYSSRISEMKLIFDSEGNLYEAIDYGHSFDGYPNTSQGSGHTYNADKKDTLRILSRMYSPSFATKLIESVKSQKYGEGGKAEVYIENKDVKFDKKRYKGLLSDFDLDGLPNVDDPDPFGNQDTQSIEQVKFSNTFNKVLDTKKNLDVELDKFVTKLRNSTTSTEKIYARTKTPFSILNKLVDSRLLDEKRGLKDLVGTTITFKNLQDLERYMQKVVRGDLGKVIDFDDFYKNPNDGYRAYHFIVEQDGIPIELQLKTDRMKEVNILSHEAYKNKTLNKEYMLYLTTLADNADKGSKTAQDQFAEIMQNKGNVRKSLSVKNN
jgi:ppGpp synthetase/RelA/SpoT-type nucleotidyltranferase